MRLVVPSLSQVFRRKSRDKMNINVKYLYGYHAKITPCLLNAVIVAIYGCPRSQNTGHSKPYSQNKEEKSERKEGHSLYWAVFLPYLQNLNIRLLHRGLVSAAARIGETDHGIGEWLTTQRGNQNHLAKAPEKTC